MPFLTEGPPLSCKVTTGRNIKAHLYTRFANSPWLIKIPQRDFFLGEKSSKSSRFLFFGVLSEYSGSLQGTSGMFAWATVLYVLFAQGASASLRLAVRLVVVELESCWYHENYYSNYGEVLTHKYLNKQDPPSL